MSALSQIQVKSVMDEYTLIRIGMKTVHTTGCEARCHDFLFNSMKFHANRAAETKRNSKCMIYWPMSQSAQP